jgi:CRISPR/Cas system-associated protein Cas10 (large subunit of type III CRISPR-Cas system)
MTDRFDLHENRHRLKQIRDDGDTKEFANPGEERCPACGEPFERLFCTRKDTNSFQKNDGSPFCLVRGNDYIHIFRH